MAVAVAVAVAFAGQTINELVETRLLLGKNDLDCCITCVESGVNLGIVVRNLLQESRYSCVTFNISNSLNFVKDCLNLILVFCEFAIECRPKLLK